MIDTIEIELDECGGCQPYLKVGNDRVKVSMTLAAEILRRNHSRALIRKVKANGTTEETVAPSPSLPRRQI
jgi:hypothetical protein